MHACFPHKSTENEQASPRLGGERGREGARVHARARRPMEMKPSASDKKVKRPPSRLQKHAPATLRLEPPSTPSPTGAWGDGRMPIPLLSPLVVSPSAAWEPDDQAAAAAGAPRREGGVQGGAGREGSSGAAARSPVCGGDRQAADDAAKSPAPAPCGGGWLHPALSTPVAEPASLVSFFQSHCALEVHNAPQ